MNHLSINTIIAVIIAAVMTMLAFLFAQPNAVLGSVAASEGYNATTTFAASSPTIVTIKAAQGMFGSVVITGDNTGLLTFYDATTSDITLRTGQVSTSSIKIADFSASAPEGTYTFDIQTKTGLLMVGSGNIPTTTITYK